MLEVHEIEGLRRSAAMAPLSPTAVVQLLDSCEQMARQRAQVLNVLSGLSPPWSSVRSALNDLHKLMAGQGPRNA